MPRKRKGLGSLGVDALLTRNPDTDGADEANVGAKLMEIGVERIRPGRYQPRMRMDDEKLDELAASIKTQGLIQPLVVRVDDAGNYELIAGERRWRAAQRAGFEKVTVIVKDADEHVAAALALIENIQREDLSAIEEANALQQLAVKFDLTHQEVADSIGRSRSAVTNLLRLLELAPDARELLENEQLEMGHARVLLRLSRDQQGPAGREMIAQQMTVRDAEAYVESLLGEGTKKSKDKVSRPLELGALERDLGEYLSTPVHIQHGNKGGKLVIRYANLDVLDGVLEKIRKG